MEQNQEISTPIIDNESKAQSLASRKESSFSFLLLMFGVIILLIGVSLGYFLRDFTLLKEKNSPSEVSQSDESQHSTSTSLDSLETYTNTKLGFTIQYPKSLNIVPVEADPKAENREYIRKCESGEIDGCGGSRKSDFRIDFQKDDESLLFSVVVYQHPVVENGLADVLRETFSYGVRVDLDNISILSSEEQQALSKESLLSTLTFIELEKPLLCLWDTDLGPGFDPMDDKEYINDNIDRLTLFSGYYANSKSSACERAEYYSWSTQQDTDGVPFETQEDCQLTCFNK